VPHLPNADDRPSPFEAAGAVLKLRVHAGARGRGIHDRGSWAWPAVLDASAPVTI
jgi:hypothetical protein